MTDPDEPQEPVRATPEQMRQIARKLILPHAIFVPAALAACVWFVLYVLGGEGKKAAAAQCEASRAVAERIAPFAKGDFAALAVRSDPKPMPELSFAGPQGPTTLASFRGKPILLNAWATWCVPCREEMPALDRLQGAVEGVTVVALNVDTAKKERARAFFGEIGVKNLGFYQDADGASFEALRRAGKVLGLPTTFVVGPDGCEIAALAGPAKWDGDEAKALVGVLK
ncbi:redoxin family protein [Rhodoblastus acidophilus]|uniref:Redoxin family protein n=1 Tax=Rhodoblastus acidophilus TaxID=1074 RepID=A0A6N8DT68_RHOAC|nr:TlpA disulfide reductase family protein [Rhodoblastus acidophilus]MCW2275757.1 thiol-disulfide isomerase/thioredoxin [Rhodoblastus acidophilus]MTV32361.1 redoxin family protein [Rhodoblastus acidophilus]